MVTVYTWLPTPHGTVLAEGLMPDLGHSSLLIQDESGAQEDVYCSYWPEMDSAIRRVVNLWKNRTVRSARSYAEESDPEAGFMQRPADFLDTLHNLREDRLRRAWEQVKDSDYDVVTWNCSNVIQCLLIVAMGRNRYEQVQSAVECTPEGLEKADLDADQIGTTLRYLATSEFIGCRPEDVHRLSVAYQEAFSGTAG